MKYSFILFSALFVLLAACTQNPEPAEQQEPAGNDFGKFLSHFKRAEFPAKFSSRDFRPNTFFAAYQIYIDGLYSKELFTDSLGRNVAEYMLSSGELNKVLKGSKAISPEFAELLAEHDGVTEVGWFELYPGIHVSTKEAEIVSLHIYSAFSATNGGSTHNWMLFFSKAGTLLHMEELENDLAETRNMLYEDESEEEEIGAKNAKDQTTEVTNHTFTLHPDLLLETTAGGSILAEYSDDDTSYVKESRTYAPVYSKRQLVLRP